MLIYTVASSQNANTNGKGHNNTEDISLYPQTSRFIAICLFIHYSLSFSAVYLAKMLKVHSWWQFVSFPFLCVCV